MSNRNFTDEEIIKALELCSIQRETSDCLDCPMEKGCCLGGGLEGYALNIIKKAKAEIEALKLINSTYECSVEHLKAVFAWEIFEEIENAINLNLLVIENILNAKGGRANGKTVLLAKQQAFTETKKFLAELKKKYTEGE